MKKHILLILIYFLFLTSFSFAINEETYKVIKVTDGDTIYVDFNKNGYPEADEKIRINGIDTFEVKPSQFLDYQMKNYNLTQKEALGLGYLGKEFAKKELLNKYVIVKYTSDIECDTNNRKLMSVYYDNGKNYEEEVLKAGLGVVYKESNLASQLQQFENLSRMKRKASKTHDLKLAYLNLKNNKVHKIDCEYGLKTWNKELVDISNKNNINWAYCCLPKLPYLKKDNNKTFSKNLIKKINNNSQNIKNSLKRKFIFLNSNKPNAINYAAYYDNEIEIYFLDPTVDYKKVKNGALLRLLNLIDNSKDRIYFAIYGISNWDVINRLLIQLKNGIDIKWVTDVNKFGKNNYNKTAYLQTKIKTFMTDKDTKELSFDNKQNVNLVIKNQKITTTFVDEEIKYFTDQLMHNKFFIFDYNTISTGSTNISESGIGGIYTNANDFIVIKSKVINNIYTKEFIQMYNGNFHKKKINILDKKNIKLNEDTIISIYFAPKDTDFMFDVMKIIDNSKQFIYVPMFYLTDKKVIQSLINAHERGVDVKIIIDATSAQSKYSKHKILRIAGIPVKVENWIGKMHMKCLISDNYIVTGSLNWTSRGQYFNDENSLIIQNYKIAQVYKKHFMSLYNSIPDKWLTNDPKPEGPDSPGTCCDGRDNDHDGFIDMDDMDCNPNGKQGKLYSDYYNKQK